MGTDTDDMAAHEATSRQNGWHNDACFEALRSGLMAESVEGQRHIWLLRLVHDWPIMGRVVLERT